MGSDEKTKGGSEQWESVHVCPKCGHFINLSEIDLRTVTTGIVDCPRCEWVGQIEIQIVAVDEST